MSCVYYTTKIPQMAPMNWLNLYFYFNTLFFCMLVKVYFV